MSEIDIIRFKKAEVRKRSARTESQSDTLRERERRSRAAGSGKGPKGIPTHKCGGFKKVGLTHYTNGALCVVTYFGRFRLLAATLR